MNTEAYMERKRLGRLYSLRLNEKTPKTEPLTSKQKRGRLLYLLAMLFSVHLPVGLYFLGWVLDWQAPVLVPIFPCVGIVLYVFGLVFYPCTRAIATGVPIFLFWIYVAVGSCYSYEPDRVERDQYIELNSSLWDEELDEI